MRRASLRLRWLGWVVGARVGAGWRGLGESDRAAGRMACGADESRSRGFEEALLTSGCQTASRAAKRQILLENVRSYWNHTPFRLVRYPLPKFARAPSVKRW